ncbi:MAG: hypothetical protein AAF415_00910 [Pseudomonadota bacterium]
MLPNIIEIIVSPAIRKAIEAQMDEPLRIRHKAPVKELQLPLG